MLVSGEEWRLFKSSRVVRSCIDHFSRDRAFATCVKSEIVDQYATEWHRFRVFTFCNLSQVDEE